MESKIQIAELRSQHQNKIALLNFNGIDHQTFENIRRLKNHVRTNSNSWNFIILLPLNCPISDLDINDLKKQKGVLSIFICVKPNADFKFQSDNVYPVLQELIYHKIKACIVKFFEDTGKRFLSMNLLVFASIFMEKAKDLKQQPVTNGKVICLY